MHLKRYSDIHAFYKDTHDVLMRHEAQNLIPLGNIIMGNEGKDKTDWRDPANWFMATISDGNRILLTALMTPPHNITLYATDNIINSEAVISQIALDKGFTKCVLYTDLANPTSNRIYQKIGYVPVCDSSVLKFESRDVSMECERQK